MRRKILEIILISCLFFPLPLFFSMGSGLLSEQLVRQMVNYISVALPQIFIVIYILFVQKEPLEQYGIKKPSLATFSWMGVTLIAALSIMMVFILLYSLLPSGAQEKLLQEQQFALSSPAQLPLAAVFCLAVGYREEVFFRAYLLTRLGQLGVKPIWAMLGSSFIFGMAHFNQGIFGVLTTFAIGLLFAGIFFMKRDIHTIAGAHTLYNFTLLFLSLMGKQFQF